MRTAEDTSTYLECDQNAKNQPQNPQINVENKQNRPQREDEQPRARRENGQQRPNERRNRHDAGRINTSSTAAVVLVLSLRPQPITAQLRTRSLLLQINPSQSVFSLPQNHLILLFFFSSSSFSVSSIIFVVSLRFNLSLCFRPTVYIRLISIVARYHADPLHRGPGSFFSPSTRAQTDRHIYRHTDKPLTSQSPPVTCELN